MIIVVPDYYKEFNCIANKCQHTCCRGWEIDVDEESLERFLPNEYIMQKIDSKNTPHFTLLEDENCPFLREDGLCNMIIKYGEDMLCQICKDHPRFRNYWTNRVEIGLGLVCEAAGKIILTKDKSMELVVLQDDGNESSMPEDEEWLLEYRNTCIKNIEESGPLARLKEYLYYRHIADALYDDLLEERVSYVDYLFKLIKEKWEGTDRSIDSLIECAREISYDYEYDDEMFEKHCNSI